MKYSVLTFNIDGYEVLHEIPEQCLNPEIEFIYVTNDPRITSETWTVVLDTTLTGSSFDKCFQVRYQPFKYVHTDIVMKIDGSMAINKDLMPLFKRFEEGDFDCAMMIHPTRNTMYEEYRAWVGMRGYPREQAEKSLNFMLQNGYNIGEYKGLFQYNFMIQRKNDINLRLNAETYNVLKINAPEGDTIDRLDQTIGTFVINTHYPDLKIMPVGQYICFDSYFKWCRHGTDLQMIYNSANDIEPFMRNQMTTIWYV